MIINVIAKPGSPEQEITAVDGRNFVVKLKLQNSIEF